ncbi:MAG TPA: hypothetical protein VD713_03015, partial [Sphingomonadales bacterium]|nr:hypothetical protein [Sphingomonadales bacterium]
AKEAAEIAFTFHNAEMPHFFQGEEFDSVPPATPENLDRDFIGLRLALARSILRLHGGAAAYNLRPDRDSTIVCTIARTFTKRLAEAAPAPAEADAPQI